MFKNQAAHILVNQFYYTHTASFREHGKIIQNDMIQNYNNTIGMLRSQDWEMMMPKDKGRFSRNSGGAADTVLIFYASMAPHPLFPATCPICLVLLINFRYYKTLHRPTIQIKYWKLDRRRDNIFFAYLVLVW